MSGLLITYLLAIRWMQVGMPSHCVTLNLGVRWEGETPARDSGGQIANFDPNAISGMVQSNELWPFQSDPSPHIGFAWDITGKGTTVIRAGGSVAYAEQAMISWSSLQNDSMQSFPTGATLFYADGTSIKGPGNIVTFQSQAQPLTSGSPSVIVPATALPWTAGAAIFSAASFVPQCGNGRQVPGSSPAVFNPASCTLFGAYPNYKNPYVTTWNLSAQHAFTSALTLNVTYVGTHGTDLPFEGDINQPTPGAPGSGELLRRPFYAAANNTYGDDYPWFGKAVFNFNGGKSNYNGLQISFAGRSYHGLSFDAGYTFAHALGTADSDSGSLMNIANQAAEYGNMSIDYRQRFTLTNTYNIPGVKVPLQMLDGWSLTSSVTILTPGPVNVFDNTFDTSGTGTKLDRWNLYGNPNDFNKVIGGLATVPCYGVTGSKFAIPSCTTVMSVGLMPASCIAEANLEPNGPTGVANNTGMAQLAAIGCYVAGPNNESAIVPPAQGTFGTMQRNALRPYGIGGFKNWDLSLQKSWKLKERVTAQFRAEGFNVLNRTDFALPSGALGTPTSFGRAASTTDVSKNDPITGSGGPREVQSGLKLIF